MKPITRKNQSAQAAIVVSTQRITLAAAGMVLFAIVTHSAAPPNPIRAGKAPPRLAIGSAIQIKANTIAHFGRGLYTLPLREYTPFTTTSGCLFSITNLAGRPLKTNGSSNPISELVSLGFIVIGAPFMVKICLPLTLW